MRRTWTDEARTDLAALSHYIAQDNAKAAGNQVRLIRAAAARLGDHAFLGRPGRIAGTRELVVSGTPYIVIYTVRSSDILILRVMHGAQQWPPAEGPA